MILNSKSNENTKDSSGGFGTFKGVFTPSILTILGVIMYLRMGWVVGNVGLFGTIVIVTMASTVTFLTALSISATATNMRVGGGGAYYMISRSLGVEAGAAIGLPLFLAQALGISFYLTGFAESLQALFPAIPMLAVNLVSLVILTGLAYSSADLALKIQYLILGIIILSLLSFIFGGPMEMQTQPVSISGETESFWTVFAVFFPAVTGILAGVSMSGDLKNTFESLPKGTLAAVGVGYLVYILVPFILWLWVPTQELLADPMVMQKVAAVPQLILLGIWGATLSSALGSLLGAPRTLQALARDGVLPRVLGRGTGDSDTPRIATGVTFAVAALGALLGDLNAIAPVLSMFFLTAYGVINFSAGMEGLISSPSWRPTFKTPWVISMLGAVLCFATMFMINAGATFIALAFSGAVFYFMERRNIRVHWGDMRQGILMLIARFAIYNLSEAKPDPKSWRPYILVLSGSPKNRWHLISLANAISQGKGFLTILSVLNTEMTPGRKLSIRNSTKEFLMKKKVAALVETYQGESPFSGGLQFIKSYGIGPLVPNTVLLGVTEKEDLHGEFTEFVMKLYRMKKNVIIVRDNAAKDLLESDGKNVFGQRQVDVWWGRERQNAGLMLAFGYLLRQSQEWRGTALTLKTVVNSEEDRVKAVGFLNSYIQEARVQADAEALVKDPETNAFEIIKDSSSGSDLVFVGLRPPGEEESAEDYMAYYQKNLERTKDFPPTVFALAGEGVKYNKIFS